MNVESWLTPYKLLKEAIKAVPAIRYALGIAGIASLIAIIANYNIDKETILFGVIIVIVLMVVLVIFEKFVNNTHDINFKPHIIFLTWTSLILTALVLLLLIYKYFSPLPEVVPKHIIESEKLATSCVKDDDLDNRISSMLTNVSNPEYYVHGEVIANEILKKCPKESYALYAKGAANFFRGNFQEAVFYFSEVLSQKPTNFNTLCNLGDTYIELGMYNEALDVYNKVRLEDKSNESWMYLIGRAYLYTNNLEMSKQYLNQVPDKYANGGARILEAALLIKESKGIQNLTHEQLSVIKEKISIAFHVDRSYWNKIFKENWQDKHRSRSFEVNLLLPILTTEGLLS